MLAIELVESEEVLVDYRQDHLPPLTLGLYEAFLAKGDAGRDAMAAYQHLLYTYRRQGTNQVWATQSYLEKGLGMGRNRVTAARVLLREMGLTESIKTRDEKGKVNGHYVKLNLLPNPGPKSTVPETGSVESILPENHTTGKPQRGDSGQMLEEGIKMLEEEREEDGSRSSPDSPPSLLSQLREEAKKRGRVIDWNGKRNGLTLISRLESIAQTVTHEYEIISAWKVMLDTDPSKAVFFPSDFEKWRSKAASVLVSAVLVASKVDTGEIPASDFFEELRKERAKQEADPVLMAETEQKASALRQRMRASA